MRRDQEYTYMKSEYYRVIYLCIIFLLSSSVLYAQTRTFTVYLQNERNHAINGANIVITPQSRITSQRFVLQDRGGGVYTTNLPTVLIDSEFSIDINVEEYMPEIKHYFWAGENSISCTLGTLMGVDGKKLDAPYNNNVNLGYRNYYERYNVDPTSLIEIFGEFTVRLDQEQKLYPQHIRMNFLSPLPVNMVHENHQYIRPFLIRQYMYEDIIYEIILQTGLERSRYSGSVIDEFINEVERRRNIRYLNDLDQDIVSLVLLFGTYFEDSAKDIFSMLKGAAIAYDLNKAINDGVVLGLLRTIAYHSFQWESYDIFKRKAERSTLYRDRAFREAMNNVKNKIEREQNKQARELVNSLRFQLLSGVVSTEIFKGILSGGLAVGLGISSLKSALITDIVQGGFQRQVYEGAMILLTQIDKYVLDDYYDTYNAQNKYIIENNSEMYYGTLMRLHTGYIFNEMRRKYFGGENQGVIRGLFSDVIDPQIGFGSILREIASVSDEKMKKAENAYYFVSGVYPPHQLHFGNGIEEKEHGNLAQLPEVYLGKYTNFIVDHEFFRKKSTTFVTSHAFRGFRTLELLYDDRMQDYYVEWNDAHGRNIVSFEFQITGYDTLVYRQYDIADYPDRFKKVPSSGFLKVTNLPPTEIINYFLSNEWNNPCGTTSYYMNYYFRANLNSETDYEYVFWIVGCPQTRGRGILLIFEGDHPYSIIGSYFGYEVNGAFPQIAINGTNRSKYGEIRFTNSDIQLSYNVLKAEYEMVRN